MGHRKKETDKIGLELRMRIVQVSYDVVSKLAKVTLKPRASPQHKFDLFSPFGEEILRC